MKKIIIELTWLQGSWKTSIINALNPKYEKNVFYCEIFNKNYNNLKIYKKFIIRLFSILKNIKINWKIFKFSLSFEKRLIVFNKLSYSIYKINYINKYYKSKIIITDELFLHSIFSSLFLYENKINKTKIEKFLKNIILNKIQPIYIDVKYDEQIINTKKRNIFKLYDNLQDEEKKELLVKKWNLSEFITNKYCEIYNRPFLKVPSLSLKEKIHKVEEYIDLIIK